MGKIKEILNWVAVDGLLHLLVCFAMMLALTPVVVEIWWAIAATASVAVAKEVFDALCGRNTWSQMAHDFICDGVGLLLAACTVFVWWVCNL
jgi:hypothetical protein